METSEKKQLNLIEESIKNILESFQNNEIEKIFLFNQKLSLSGEITSFKICMVINDLADKFQIEKNVYLYTSCPIPFDIVTYTVSQWHQNIEKEESFACKIQRIGRLIYEKK